MDVQATSHAAAIVRSFAYVAKQLAGNTVVTPAQYKQIHGEALKHESALNLLRRDVVEHARHALRNRSITRIEYRSACVTAEHAIAKAKKEITRTLAEFADYALAA